MRQGKSMEEFTTRIRQVLDDSANDIEELTLSRVRAARANAVSTADNKQVTGRGWLPAGSFATVLVAILAVYLFNQDNAGFTSAMDAGDIETLSSVESLEMLDDLEFYQWLDENKELDEKLESNAETRTESLG